MKKLLLILFTAFSITGFAQTVTPVLYPLYIQGVGTGVPSQDRKVPYACRMTLSGLTPNATYRYYSRFVFDVLDGTNGVGVPIIVNQTGNFVRVPSVSLGTAGGYGEFTTNASGIYTGWFVIEPSSDALFQPGTQLRWRIMLNNGAGGTTVITRLNATDPVTVLNWGTTPTTGGFVNGSALWGATNTAFLPKNFVMLYNNVGGTGRPVSSTFIEADGTANTTTNGYVPFYQLLINEVNNRWGTIIPNNLANGINNISHYALSDGNIINSCTAVDGVYPNINQSAVVGTTDTRNANWGLTVNFNSSAPRNINCTPGATCNITLSTSVTNVACQGASTGAVNLTVNGGTAPFTYLWSNGATTEDISGLAAGTYSVTVTDAASCTATTSVTLTQPASALSAAATATNATCGASNGSVNLTVSGGTSPYTFLWSNGSTTEDISGLASGTYSVIITDANACTATASATVNNTGGPSVVVTSITHVLCFGQSTGAINITVSGGTSPYTYLWSNGATTEDISGLAAGTYSVTVTDATSCTATTSATVTQPASALSGTATATNATCGASNGSINLTVSGGTSPYTYLWSNGATTEDISGLAAGTYSVTITDANACTATASATVNNTGGPTVVVTGTTHVLCFGQSTGAINITVSGGTSPYTFLWSNGATTEDISGLAAGTYSVTVTDAASCTATTSATINQPASAISASATATNATCGASNGSINLTVSGGTSPYTYLWSNGATTEDISGLAAGTYSVTITDANGCTATASATVNNSGGPTVVVTSTTHVLCFGQSTGAINITVSGGTLPYTFLWSNGATTEDISGLAAGTYSVTVTDANGCTANTAATVNQPASAISASTTTTNATCGASNGSINLTVSGGTSPYTYLWSNGATTEDISGLAAGTYSVTITDANGCTATTSATVSNTGGPTVVVTGTTHILCFGQSTGAINITVSGGTSPYTFLWSNGATTEDISGLAAGTYSVVVTDQGGCTSTVSATVTQPALLSASATATNATCGASNGSINLTVSGGTTPYTYLWSNGATTEDISGLAAGTYSVTITDANACTATTSATVNNTGGPTVMVTNTSHVLCFGQSTGAVNITVSGGTAPFTYLWSNGATTEDISGLAAGTYSVTVTDANGCTANTAATVNQPSSAITSSTTTTNASCGASNGSVNLTVTGGTSPYTFLWSNGATTEDISGLAAGTYSVTITDANACTATASAIVNNTGAPTVIVTSTTHVLCFGQSTGAINITVSGGLPSYSYLWSNGATTEDISGLTAGTYSVTVTDEAGCTATVSATITQPALLTASAIASNASCGASNGSVNLAVSAGTAPYTYLWSNGATTEDISGLAAGTYTVTITDANGCTANANATVNNSGGPTIMVTSTTHVLCFGQNTGAVNITVSGGTAPYTYLWSNGATTEDISGLTAGTYSVTVTDANGCTANTAATVNQPASAITSSTTTTNATCGASNGSINLAVSGGTAPYTYLWNNGAITEDISGLAAGTYSVTITDANGCTAITNATVNNIAGPVATVLASGSTCGASNGSVNLTVSAGTLPYTFLWSNGATTEDISGLAAGTYSVTVTDANGCTVTASATVNNIAGPGATATVTNATCGASNGSINLTVSGGTMPYTYLWSNGATTEDISGLAAGTYSVTVTDANGCTATASATVNNTAGPAVVVTSFTHVLCFGQSTGAINITVSGGTAPYTYLWSNGATTEDISGLAAGTYNVTVTDANGCTANTAATVNQPASAITSSTTTTNATCGASNGSVNLTVSGGTSPYTYLWSNGATTEDISGLAAGTYTVTITDANGCTATSSATVNNIAGPTVVVTSTTHVLCFGQSTGAINITVSGGTAPFTYLWSNGMTTEDISGLTAGTYSVIVTDANGCTATLSTSITQPSQLTVLETHTAITCFGGNSTVTITATGGTAPYTGTGVFIRTAGSYSFTVTDANGCSSSVNVTLVQPTQLLAAETHTAITCFGGSSTITIGATGGTAPYTGTGIFLRGPGTWPFTVTDANGCTAVVLVSITQPSGLTATSSAGTILCNGGTTTVTVAATGGTAPYTGTGTFTRSAGTYNFTITDVNGCSAVTSITILQPSVLVAASSGGTIACNGGTATVIISATGGTAPYSGTGTFTRGPGTWSFTVTDARGCTSVVSLNITQPALLTATAIAPAITECGGTTLVRVTASGGTLPNPYPGVGDYIRGPGTWSFTVTDAAGCAATAQITIEAPDCLKVYPNPASSTITVSHTRATEGTSIGVFNMNGSLVLSEKVPAGSFITTIDLQKIAAGSYMLVYYQNGEKASVRFEKLVN